MTSHREIGDDLDAFAREAQRAATAVGEGEKSPVEMVAIGDYLESMLEDIRSNIRSLRG